MHDKLFKYFTTKTNIDDSGFEAIKPYFVLRNLKRNEILLNCGDICKHNYFVVEGCLRFFSINSEGDELTRYLGFEGKFGTSLSSFLIQSPSIEFIQSVGKSTVLAITRKDFYQLVETNPLVNFIYRDILEMAYVTSQERIYGLQGSTALERLKWLLDYHPKILSQLPSKIVASYLGVTPYTLSRLKAEL